MGKTLAELIADAAAADDRSCRRVIGYALHVSKIARSVETV